MDSWGVFGVIVAIVSFLGLVGAPLLKLNSNLTKLNVILEVLQKQFDKFCGDNEKEHNTIWTEVEKHEDSLNDHETRIQIMERKEG